MKLRAVLFAVLVLLTTLSGQTSSDPAAPHPLAGPHAPATPPGTAPEPLDLAGGPSPTTLERALLDYPWSWRDVPIRSKDGGWTEVHFHADGTFEAFTGKRTTGKRRWMIVDPHRVKVTPDIALTFDESFTHYTGLLGVHEFKAEGDRLAAANPPMSSAISARVSPTPTPAVIPPAPFPLPASRVAGPNPPAPSGQNGVSPTAPPPSKARQALLSSKWLFVNLGQQRRELVFHQDGTITCEGNAAGTWLVTGEKSFEMYGAPGAPDKEFLEFSDDLSKWASIEMKKGRRRTGTSLGPVDQIAGTPPPSSGTPDPGTPPAGSTANPARVKSPADERSQLANFYSQIPNTAAWVHAPLDVDVPPDLLANLVAFRQGMARESPNSPPDLRQAYTRADVLADLLSKTEVERAGFRRQFPATNLPPSAISRWGEFAHGHIMEFKTPRATLDDAVRAGGGVSKAVPIPGSTLPLANLPPAPANTRLPEFERTPPHLAVYADGPSGTNFGFGKTPIKIKVSVVSDSETPIPLEVRSYWVGNVDKSYKTIKADERGASVWGGHSVSFEAPGVLDRNNGVTKTPLLEGLNYPYAGWIVTLHDKSGARVGCVASMDFFPRLVP